MTILDLERRTLELWQEREKRFPSFVRRMRPDHFDRMRGGAWDICEQAANEEVSRETEPA